jgi:methionyl aminopeptidase
MQGKPQYMPDRIECMRYAGEVNHSAIKYGFSLAGPGITLLEINNAIEEYIIEHNCNPAFKNYQPLGAQSPFPFTACISPNDVVVHGIPDDYVLEPGDLLTIDVGCEYKGWFVDSARSSIIPCPMGATDEQLKNAKQGAYLIEATDAILNAQLAIIQDGCTFIELVTVSERVAQEYGIIILAQWGGHQIGNKVHLDPFIPSAIDRKQSALKQGLDAKKYTRQMLQENQTICIEPVTSYGSPDIILDDDLWTVRKRDGLLAAHTERTILVTVNGYEILS